MLPAVYDLSAKHSLARQSHAGTCIGVEVHSDHAGVGFPANICLHAGMGWLHDLTNDQLLDTDFGTHSADQRNPVGTRSRMYLQRCCGSAHRFDTS